MSTSVKECVFGPHPPGTSIRRLRLRVDLEWIVGGGEVRVALPDPKKMYADKPEADLRLLDPGVDEVWEIRSKQHPQMRIFGRFWNADVFIALLWAYRKDLGDPPWIQCADCRSEWERFFEKRLPHTGSTIHDYITENALSL